jgi:hypothetical protein
VLFLETLRKARRASSRYRTPARSLARTTLPACSCTNAASPGWTRLRA